MDAALFGHVASSLSLFTSASDFDPGAATPLVRRVMTPPEDDRQGAFADPEAGRQAALAGALVTDYVGRPLTLRVVARDGRGGAFRRDVVVELTGQARQPYWIRAID